MATAEVAWQIATGEDMRYAETDGSPPDRAARVLQRYMAVGRRHLERTRTTVDGRVRGRQGTGEAGHRGQAGSGRRERQMWSGR